MQGIRNLIEIIIINVVLLHQRSGYYSTLGLSMRVSHSHLLPPLSLPLTLPPMNSHQHLDCQISSISPHLPGTLSVYLDTSIGVHCPLPHRNSALQYFNTQSSRHSHFYMSSTPISASALALMI